MEAFKALCHPIPLGIDIGMLGTPKLVHNERRVLRDLPYMTVVGIFHEFAAKTYSKNDKATNDRFQEYYDEIRSFEKKHVLVTKQYYINSGPMELCKEVDHELLLSLIVRNAAKLGVTKWGSQQLKETYQKHTTKYAHT
jgi:hypothetical protein